jgi:RND superfamily putative drug exporter
MPNSEISRPHHPSPRPGVLARLAPRIAHHRRLVIGVWILLTLVGGFSAMRVSERWFESFSIPGSSAYEANQRTLKTFGSGGQPPLVAVFRSSGEIAKETGIEQAVAAAAAVNPGSRVSSYWSSASRNYVSRDGHTTFALI